MESAEDRLRIEHAKSMKELASDLAMERAEVTDRRESNDHYYMRKMFLRGSLTHAVCEFDNFDVGSSEDKIRFVKDAREYAGNIRDNISNGRNVVFAGNPGCGKDHVMMSIAKAAFDNGCWVYKTSGPDLRQAAMDAIKDGSLSEVVDDATSRDALWISDPAVSANSASPFYADLLYQIIDRMYNKRRPVWLTINAKSGKEIGGMIGRQAYDRVRDKSLTVLCGWDSYRKPAKAILEKKERLE